MKNTLLDGKLRGVFPAVIAHLPTVHGRENGNPTPLATPSGAQAPPARLTDNRPWRKAHGNIALLHCWTPILLYVRPLLGRHIRETFLLLGGRGRGEKSDRRREMRFFPFCAANCPTV